MKYEINTSKNEIAYDGIFSLADTLDCGQCFRFEPTGDGVWRGAALDRAVELRQENGRILFSGTSPDSLSDFARYLGFDDDYEKMRGELSRDVRLFDILSSVNGIQILRQPFWETLCSFIISQNNNIPRIKGIVSRLCSCFSDGVVFPKAELIAGLEPDELAPLRCGFRARYIIDAARKTASGEICEQALRALPLGEARQRLMCITGVGPKVADCALLYGLGRLDAFPMDVWMKRAMAELFPEGLPQCAEPFAGVAQQYIFHYIRKREGAV